ncbi:hypothetical protein HDU85_000871 [Gaertneriomyces sp. JEL0708]|nr:hypothetical protein HDU85_000871 [Gaertneriomyces sp. JEL0708]
MTHHRSDFEPFTFEDGFSPSTVASQFHSYETTRLIDMEAANKEPQRSGLNDNQLEELPALVERMGISDKPFSSIAELKQSFPQPESSSTNTAMPLSPSNCSTSLTPWTPITRRRTREPPNAPVRRSTAWEIVFLDARPLRPRPRHTRSRSADNQELTRPHSGSPSRPEDAYCRIPIFELRRKAARHSPYAFRPSPGRRPAVSSPSNSMAIVPLTPKRPDSFHFTRHLRRLTMPERLYLKSVRRSGGGELTEMETDTWGRSQGNLLQMSNVHEKEAGALKDTPSMEEGKSSEVYDAECNSDADLLPAADGDLSQFFARAMHLGNEGPVPESSTHMPYIV